MQKGEGVTSYLTRLHNVRDELATVGEKPFDDELVCTTLNGFSKECCTFVQVIYGGDTLLDWDCLWSDFTQGELRLNLAEGTISCNNKESKVEKEEEENMVLLIKGKAKKGPSQGHNSKGGEKKRKDLPKDKCF